MTGQLPRLHATYAARDSLLNVELLPRCEKPMATSVPIEERKRSDAHRISITAILRSTTRY